MQGALGTITAHHLFNWRQITGHNIDQTVNAFLAAGEAVLSRLIEGPRGAIILSMVPGDAESGAIYLYDRLKGDIYMLCFDNALDDQFSAEAFDQTFADYDLFRYVEQPNLLTDGPELAQA